ncbi:hypothetical protein [Nocardia australiensis]|uniref:hypothetical protein n=1 Tax=Nocardia australiensis TaxID=2887191 RepID=UPI001D153555|nr:hypothetical protein [Nocardia australiensis]
MPDEQSAGSSEIAALAQQVATARGKLPLQHDSALLAVLSDEEVAAERELAEWVRTQRRLQRRRAVEDELAAEVRDRRTAAAIRKADDADARWHRRALAARRRVSNQDARLAQLYRRAEWSSRALIAVVVLGMVWAGVNVQHNLVPSGDMTDPLYWLSYGIEAMISIPIITIMVAATTAARWGRELARGKVIFFEAALLGTTIALNAGPHLAAGALGRAAEYAIAPIMVGVVIWLHAWVSARYALLIDSAPVVDADDGPNLQQSRRVVATVPTIPRDEPADLLELLANHDVDPLADPTIGPTGGTLESNSGTTSPEQHSTGGDRLHTGARTAQSGQRSATPIVDAGDRPGASKAQPDTNDIRIGPDEIQSGSDEIGPSSSDIQPDAINHQGSMSGDHTDLGLDQSVRGGTQLQVASAEDNKRSTAEEPRGNSVDVSNETAQALPAEPPYSETDDIVAELDDVEVWAAAREIAERGLSTLPVEQLAEILTLADQSWTPLGIGSEVGLPRSSVARVLDSARKVRRPYAVS